MDDISQEVTGQFTGTVFAADPAGAVANVSDAQWDALAALVRFASVNTGGQEPRRWPCAGPTSSAGSMRPGFPPES